MDKNINGARLLLNVLLENQINSVFGYPGGANLTLYDEIHKQSDILHFLFCHEQGSVHAAEGYARSTGKIGVVFLTSGPGATNGVTGIADAMLDSVPLLIITSQVPSHLIGSDAFQEADIIGITKSITKHNYLINNVNDLYQTVNEAIHIATTGRPGPVLIDIPKDVLASLISNNNHIFKARESYKQNLAIKEESVNQIIEMMKNAKKPIFYCGGGVVGAGLKDSKVTENLKKIVEITQFPITTTLMGLGCYSGDDQLSLHMLGMHGTYEANMAMHDCDLMIAIGVRFDDRITGKLAAFSPNSKKIHIDIDPAEINKNVKVDLSIVADCGEIIEKLLNKLHNSKFTKLENWWDKIKTWQNIKCLDYQQDNESTILPQYALDKLYELTKKYSPIFTTDVGQHQMWAAQYCKVQKAGHFISSSGLGTMGFGLPAAIGAQLSSANQVVICITGEGSFMMNIQELSTIKRYNLPIKIVLLRNNYLGMVRQWQDRFYQGRHTEVDFSAICPDFDILMSSFGIKSKTISNPNEIENSIKEMVDYKGAFFLQIEVKRDENVYPMIAPNSAHNEIILKDNV